MKTHLFFYSSIFVFLFSGCNKPDKDTNFNDEGRIARIENENHKIIAEFSYDEKGLVKESWDYNELYNESKNAEYSYSYNAKGELIGKRGFEPGNMLMSSMTGAMDKKVEYNYKYNENKLIDSVLVAFIYEGYPQINFKRAYCFRYPSEELITKTTYSIYPEANSFSSYEDFVMNKNGNIAEIVSYTMITPTEKHIYSKTEFTYDDKKAPFSLEPGPKSVNNILTKIVTAYNYDEQGNQSIGYTSEFTYEYLYNEDGYPEKVTETYPNEIINISYYFYKLNK